MLKGRSTGEILVLLIAITICTVVIGAMLIIGTLEIMDATTDTSSAVNVLSDVLNTLIGLMAGFLAGSTNRKQKDELAD